MGLLGIGGSKGPALNDLRALSAARSRASDEFESGKTRLDEQIAAAKMEEEKLKGQLSQRRRILDDQIKQRLSQDLAGIGVQAGEARANVGQQMAGSGLLRSSFTQQGIGDVNLQEQQARGEARLGAEKQFAATKAAELGTAEAIDTRREGMKQSRLVQETGNAQQRFNMLDQALLKAQMENEMAQAQFDADERAMFGSLIGGALGATAGAFVGSPLMGAQIGSGIGAAQ